MSGDGYAPLPAEAEGISAQDPAVKSTTSSGEQAASSSRQLSYTEIYAAYVGVVAGRPVKGANAGVNFSAPFPNKSGDSQEGKRGREEKATAELPVSKSLRGEKDVTMGTNADVHLAAQPIESNKPGGTLKPTAKGIDTASVPAASMEAAPSSPLPGHPMTCPGLRASRPMAPLHRPPKLINAGSEVTKR
jgi:hypothetical protein